MDHENDFKEAQVYSPGCMYRKMYSVDDEMRCLLSGMGMNKRGESYQR